MSVRRLEPLFFFNTALSVPCEFVNIYIFSFHFVNICVFMFLFMKFAPAQIGKWGGPRVTCCCLHFLQML